MNKKINNAKDKNYNEENEKMSTQSTAAIGMAKEALDIAKNKIKEFVDNGGLDEIADAGEKVDSKFNEWGDRVASKLLANTYRLSDKEIEEYCTINDLTVTALKSLRCKDENALIVANTEEMLKDMTLNCDQKVLFEKILEKYPESVLVGQLSPAGELKMFTFAKDCEDRIYTLLSKNGGRVIID